MVPAAGWHAVGEEQQTIATRSAGHDSTSICIHRIVCVIIEYVQYGGDACTLCIRRSVCVIIEYVQYGRDVVEYSSSRLLCDSVVTWCNSRRLKTLVASQK